MLNPMLEVSLKLKDYKVKESEGRYKVYLGNRLDFQINTYLRSDGDIAYKIEENNGTIMYFKSVERLLMYLDL